MIDLNVQDAACKVIEIIQEYPLQYLWFRNSNLRINISLEEVWKQAWEQQEDKQLADIVQIAEQKGKPPNVLKY